MLIVSSFQTVVSVSYQLLCGIDAFLWSCPKTLLYVSKKIWQWKRSGVSTHVQLGGDLILEPRSPPRFFVLPPNGQVHWRTGSGKLDWSMECWVMRWWVHIHWNRMRRKMSARVYSLFGFVLQSWMSSSCQGTNGTYWRSCRENHSRLNSTLFVHV